MQGESKQAEELKAAIANKLAELDRAIRDAVMYEVTNHILTPIVPYYKPNLGRGDIPRHQFRSQDSLLSL